MEGTREVTVSGYADRDMAVGDAVYIVYSNGTTPDPIGMHFTHPADSGTQARVCHGAVIHGGLAGELITVRLALGGTIGVKTTWTGTLNPGDPVYPPVESRDAVSKTQQDAATNKIGIYVGRESLSSTNSGQICEIMIVRVGPHYDV